MSSSDKTQKSGSGGGGNPQPENSSILSLSMLCINIITCSGLRERWGKSIVRHMLFDSGGAVGEANKKWVEEMKGSLGLMASIIATLTFQLATNPPGGVVQASFSDDVRCSNRNGVYICAGEAVLAGIHEGTYRLFLVSNTISFLASLHVCILLVTGIPLKGRFLIWLLSIAIWVSVTNLALTYLFAASMVTPTSIWPSVVGSGFGVAVVVWVSVIVISSAYKMVYPSRISESQDTSKSQDAV